MTDFRPTNEPAPNTAPRHVAIIMDGNNRWAKRRGLPGVAGHRAGVEAIREVLRTCRKQGVEVLTLFAFSSENWQRPSAEVRTMCGCGLTARVRGSMPVCKRK
jgi:undecaprenyl diphosphate synthase